MQKGKKGKKKRKGKKGKKKKLEPGQAECQTNAAGCLRLISLSDNNKATIIKEQGIRFLTPLLTAKLDHARWHARQVMLNCAMLPDYTKLMELYKVTGRNGAFRGRTPLHARQPHPFRITMCVCVHPRRG